VQDIHQHFAVEANDLQVINHYIPSAAIPQMEKFLADYLSSKTTIAQLAKNPAMKAAEEKRTNTGGIDLTPARMDLQTQNDNGKIKFHLDPAELQQLQNAPGFVPVIISVKPLTDLREFLGIGVLDSR
jgi:hypothetical protein